MTTATPIRNPQASSPDAAAAATTRSGADGSSPAVTRAEGLHNRKLRVMLRCSEIAPDKTHPAHHFQYVSIQNLSNHLRKFCAEEGLDIVTSITDGTVVVELINADNPEEKSVSTWPVVAGDKGFAFSIKFPLMRLFLIGDGEENDEAVMAENSGRAAVERAFPAPASPLPPARSGNGSAKPVAKGEPCEVCAEAGYRNKKGYPPKIWADARTCDGVDGEGEYLNHPRKSAVPPVTADVSPDGDGRLPWDD